MAALQCEFCGGKLITKAGGICECDSCGMEFDKTWVKEKIQEIKGTVKVEGTVKIKGNVKVDGPIKVDNSSNKDNYLKRGWNLLEDKNWKQADEYFDKVLDIDPECGEAYAGKLCAEMRLSHIVEISISTNRLDQIAASRWLQKAMQYGDEDLQWSLSENLETGRKVRDLSRARKLLAEKRRIEDLDEAKQLIEKSALPSQKTELLEQCEAAIAELKTTKANDFDYRRACAFMRTGKTKDLKLAIPLFEQLGDWKDSKKLLTECRRELELQKRRDRLYNEEMQLVKERQNTGIFSFKRRKEITDRLDLIARELKELK